MAIYKNKFIIAVYNTQEECIFVADNPMELANFTKKSMSTINNVLSPIIRSNFEKTDSIIIIEKQRCTVHLVPFDE